MEIKNIIEANIANTSLIYAVFASPINKSENNYKKITIKPISSDCKIFYQLEKFTEKQVFHENISIENIAIEIFNLFNKFKNINLFTSDADYQILGGKKGNFRIIKQAPTKKVAISSHNRAKKYIIPENKPCDFLIELGVMNQDGKVLAKKI